MLMRRDARFLVLPNTNILPSGSCVQLYYNKPSKPILTVKPYGLACQAPSVPETLGPGELLTFFLTGSLDD